MFLPSTFLLVGLGHPANRKVANLAVTNGPPHTLPLRIMLTSKTVTMVT